jgi:hypothetical protein
MSSIGRGANELGNGGREGRNRDLW